MYAAMISGMPETRLAINSMIMSGTMMTGEATHPSKPFVVGLSVIHRQRTLGTARERLSAYVTLPGARPRALISLNSGSPGLHFVFSLR